MLERLIRKAKVMSTKLAIIAALIAASCTHYYDSNDASNATSTPSKTDAALSTYNPSALETKLWDEAKEACKGVNPMGCAEFYNVVGEYINSLDLHADTLADASPSNITERTYFITLPVKDNSGKKISETVFTQFSRELYSYFGGVSIQKDTQGCWYDKRHDKLVCDENMVFSSSRDCSDPLVLINNYGTASCSRVMDEHDRPFVTALAEKYGKMLGQSAVYARETADDVMFVDGTWKETVSSKLLENNKEK